MLVLTRREGESLRIGCLFGVKPFYVFLNNYIIRRVCK